MEIALGPKEAFENGHIGTLTRHVPADWVMSAVPHRQTTPTPPKVPRTPRVVELLRNAIEWQTLLESGEVTSQAEVARREGLTQARVTQVMGMLRLAPRDSAAHPQTITFIRAYASTIRAFQCVVEWPPPR